MLYGCIKFRGNRLRDFDFRTQKPPQKFGVKIGLIQKLICTEKYGKNISRVICLTILTYPYQPTFQPTFGREEFFFFLFFAFFPFFFFFPLFFLFSFFFLNTVRSSFPNPQNTQI